MSGFEVDPARLSHAARGLDDVVRSDFERAAAAMRRGYPLQAPGLGSTLGAVEALLQRHRGVQRPQPRRRRGRGRRDRGRAARDPAQPRGQRHRARRDARPRAGGRDGCRLRCRRNRCPRGRRARPARVGPAGLRRESGRGCGDEPGGVPADLVRDRRDGAVVTCPPRWRSAAWSRTSTRSGPRPTTWPRSRRACRPT